MLYNMKDLLAVAKVNKFAVPAFNIGSLEILKASISSAEEMNSPVILEIHPAELEYLGDEFIETVKIIAENSIVPVVIHLDHGSSIEEVKRAIKCGFTSVMIDGSTLSYEDNIKITQQVVQLAKERNVSVEAELGTIGNTGNSIEGGSEIIYTDPTQALDFIEKTKINTLAIAIGTSHGLYPKDCKPKLNIELLKIINDTVDIPLVLHGGSGNTDSEVSDSINYGVCKVNISSDVKSEFFKTCTAYMLENPKAYEPNEIFPKCIERAKNVMKHKLTIFNTVGKATLYK